ncbi:class I SAM-dependent methyltransferase [Actinokineospora sp. 24-640]
MTESVELGIDPSNVDQLRAWDGDTGAYWAAQADRYDEGVAAYHGQFLDAAGIGAGERVLDIGCGTGQATRDAARRAVGGSALGVDLSSPMIALARERAEREGVGNVGFTQADAQVHAFAEQHFDVAISRSGAMFFGDPRAAFDNIGRALRPGGRLVLMAWQPIERNGWVPAFRAALALGRDLPTPPADGPGPFSLGDADRVRDLLGSAGFHDVRLRGLAEPMCFGRDADDAVEFIGGQFAAMLDGLTADDRARALANLRATMAERQTGRGVLFDSAIWLIEAQR